MTQEIERLRNDLEELKRVVRNIAGGPLLQGDLQRGMGEDVYDACVLIPLAAPLTSTSWDGDAFSTTAKTLIDLSAVFAVPDGVRAVYMCLGIRDSASATNDCYLILSPNSTAGEGIYVRCDKSNDVWVNAAVIVPCDANGDIYYQIAASGAGTFDIVIQIWGYSF